MQNSNPTDHETGMGSCRNLEEPGMNPFLLQFFEYHDISGRAFDGCEKADRNQLPDCIPREALQCVLFHRGHMLGMHHGLVEIILPVHVFLREASATATPSAKVIARAVQIWQIVSDWTGFEAASDFSHMYEAYISAISIWVLPIIYSGDMASEKVQVMVGTGLMSLTAMEGSAFQTTSVFAFYFVGLGCTCWSDRDAPLKGLNRLEIAQHWDTSECFGYSFDRSGKNANQDGVVRWILNIKVRSAGKQPSFLFFLDFWSH
jgi:hypothetical protein